MRAFRGAGHPHRVFASPYKDGQVPFWPDSALTDFVEPATTRAGITKRVGWHTFRHTYSALLRANGTDVKVQSELLLHSNIRNHFEPLHASCECSKTCRAGADRCAIVNCLTKRERKVSGADARKPAKLLRELVAGGGFEPPTFGL